jgi:hypothetical protein
MDFPNESILAHGSHDEPRAHAIDSAYLPKTIAPSIVIRLGLSVQPNQTVFCDWDSISDVPW